MKGKVELTTMCAVVEGERVLMIRREKSWTGWAFPGGHVEAKESIAECIIRELQEETGLMVKDLNYKGIANIYNTNTGDRHIITNFIVFSYEGKIKEQCEEGELSWVNRSEIDKLSLAEGMVYRLPLFFEEGVKELYIEWDERNGYTKIEYHRL